MNGGWLLVILCCHSDEGLHSTTTLSCYLHTAEGASDRDLIGRFVAPQQFILWSECFARLQPPAILNLVPLKMIKCQYTLKFIKIQQRISYWTAAGEQAVQKRNSIWQGFNIRRKHEGAVSRTSLNVSLSLAHQSFKPYACKSICLSATALKGEHIPACMFCLNSGETWILLSNLACGCSRGSSWFTASEETSHLLPVDTVNDVRITTTAAAAAIDNPQSMLSVVLTGVLWGYCYEEHFSVSPSNWVKNSLWMWSWDVCRLEFNSNPV